VKHLPGVVNCGNFVEFGFGKAKIGGLMFEVRGWYFEI
jgi:hypothetical protein